jgi:hypothetical protein
LSYQLAVPGERVEDEQFSPAAHLGFGIGTGQKVGQYAGTEPIGLLFITRERLEFICDMREKLAIGTSIILVSFSEHAKAESPRLRIIHRMNKSKTKGRTSK